MSRLFSLQAAAPFGNTPAYGAQASAPAFGGFGAASAPAYGGGTTGFGAAASSPAFGAAAGFGAQSSPAFGGGFGGASPGRFMSVCSPAACLYAMRLS